MHKYTDEERQFLAEFVPGHTHKEIWQAFNNKFNLDVPIGAIKGYIARHKLNTGKTGYFEKGHTPANKGVKGLRYAGCEKTWFKKGQAPINHRLVGSERITKDGYIEIKVSEPNIWDLKHRVVWRKHNGEIPKGHVLIFKDQDKLNVSIDNLMLVSRKKLKVLNQNRLLINNAEINETACIMADIIIKTQELNKREDK